MKSASVRVFNGLNWGEVLQFPQRVTESYLASNHNPLVIYKATVRLLRFRH